MKRIRLYLAAAFIIVSDWCYRASVWLFRAPILLFLGLLPACQRPSEVTQASATQHGHMDTVWVPKHLKYLRLNRTTMGAVNVPRHYWVFEYRPRQAGDTYDTTYVLLSDDNDFIILERP